MSQKAIVLSSGGVDSTTCVGLAVQQFGAENTMTVSVVYGQKHSREIEFAEKIAQHYGLKHQVLDISSVYQASNCSLLKHSSEEVPEGDYASQVNRDPSGKVSTYVPFRNGTMLSLVAVLAQSIFPDDEVHVYLGAHADDAAGNAYADCSQAFTSAMAEAIRIGTYGKVILETPFVTWNKAEIVKKGLEIRVPYEKTLSCYVGDVRPCGRCGTCIDRAKAFEANGVKDPALEVLYFE